MLKAASRLEHVDLRLARETYLDALTAALFAGRLAVGRERTGGGEGGTCSTTLR